MATHEDINPAILYFGTPTALITTLHPETSQANIGPMSSIFWLRDHCILGLAAYSQTTHNLLSTGTCTISLPCPSLAPQVDRIARTTASNPVPPHKQAMGYVHHADKFTLGRFTPLPSCTVPPPGIAECPVVMEARLVNVLDLFADEGAPAVGTIKALEVKIERVRVHPELRLEGFENRIDPDRWRPLIMMFSQFYALGEGRVVGDSRLARIDEEMYRGPRRKGPVDVAGKGAEVNGEVEVGERETVGRRAGEE